MLNTTFDQFLEFPCNFSFKIIGDSDSSFVEGAIVIAQNFVPGDYSTPQIKTSSKGNYCSLTLNVIVDSKELIETLYIEFAKVLGVIRVL